MSKTKRQDLTGEVPWMQLAADLTRFSDDGKASNQVKLKYRRQLKKCLVDTSLLLDIFEKSRSSKKREDNTAFDSLIEFARAQKIQLLVNPSLAEEWKQISPRRREVINDKTRNAFKVSAEGIHFQNGLRPYTTTWPAGTFSDPTLNQFADLSAELPQVDNDPSILKEDRNHYCWACINRLVFLTTDYKFIRCVAKAIPRQIEKFGAEEWKLPANRVPLRAAAMRPKSYLETLIANQIVKEIGPMNPSEAIAQLKQLAEVANNHKMGSGKMQRWAGPLLGQPGHFHPILELLSEENDEVTNDHINTIAEIVGYLHEGNKNAVGGWHGDQSEIVTKLRFLTSEVEKRLLGINQPDSKDHGNKSAGEAVDTGVTLFPKGIKKIDPKYVQAARELYANHQEKNSDATEYQNSILKRIFGTQGAEAARKKLDRYQDNDLINQVWKKKEALSTDEPPDESTQKNVQNPKKP